MITSKSSSSNQQVQSGAITGLVAQTHADIDNYMGGPFDPLEVDAIRHSTIDNQKLEQYLQSRVVPDGTVLVFWQHGIERPYELLEERAIQLIDRELCIGDAVRRRPDDPVSGTVISATATANLLEPQRWPTKSSGISQSSSRPTREISGVDVTELVDSLDIDEGRIIFYHGWIGRVIDFTKLVKVRLPDGSVIELEDADGQILTVDDRPVDDIHVGDLIKVKKSNLRKGRAIFGKYNPNTTPIGCVAEVTVNSVEIDWLQPKPCNPNHEADPEMPSSLLESSELEAASLYGSQHRTPWSGLDTVVGDKVRLRTPSNLLTKRGDELCWIPRQQTLGYDINVYTVLSTSTHVEVRWQDGSISQHFSVDLTPIMDFGDDDDVWPGELISTRAAKQADGVRTPEKAGIVQSVKARDRLAAVKWFEGTVSFIDGDEQSLIPGSWTGELSSEVEEVSLYDIWVDPGFPRRLGDLLVIIPPFGDANDDLSAWKLYPRYRAVWGQVGEVVELRNDGLIRLHLGGSRISEDVSIPWECTLMAYSSDLSSTDEDDEESDDGDEDDSMEDDGIAFASDALGNFRATPTTWTDEQGHNIDDTEAESREWLTEEDESQEMEVDEAMQDAPAPAKSVDDIKSYRGELSYEALLAKSPARQGSDDPLDGFKVLEGDVPDDHHYKSEKVTSTNGRLLKRIQKEHSILRSSLPSGIFVRTWESSLHLLRILILGPLETPYEYAPFLIDVFLGESYPMRPPQLFFHSWTKGTGPVNPVSIQFDCLTKIEMTCADFDMENLYENGKICLSLLGTWSGNDPSETWRPQATLLQVLVSLLGLVLVRDPYYNEAGFEAREGSREYRIPSAAYAERSFLKSRDFILHALNPPVAGFEAELEVLFLRETHYSPLLLLRAIYDAIVVIKNARSYTKDTVQKSNVNLGGTNRIISVGAARPLERTVRELLAYWQGTRKGGDLIDRLQAMLNTSKEQTSSAMPSLEDVLRPTAGDNPRQQAGLDRGVTFVDQGQTARQSGTGGLGVRLRVAGARARHRSPDPWSSSCSSSPRVPRSTNQRLVRLAAQHMPPQHWPPDTDEGATVPEMRPRPLAGTQRLPIVLSVAAAVFIGLRLWAKNRRRTIGNDDYLIIVGLILTWVLAIEDVVWVETGFEGRSMETLKPPEIVIFFKNFFANQVTYTIVPLPIKLSILLSYNRIFGAFTYFRYASFAVATITVLWSLSMLIFVICQCRPTYTFWENPGPEHCLDLTKYAYSNAISNILIDVIILTMPAVPLWRLQISSLQRRLAVGSFALGFFVCIASILRITTIGQVGATNLTSAIVAPCTWTIIEPSVGIISACLPFLRPLFSRGGLGTSAYDQSGRSAGHRNSAVPFGASAEEGLSSGTGRKKKRYSGFSVLDSGIDRPRDDYAKLSTPSKGSFELRSMEHGTGRRTVENEIGSAEAGIARAR
ncbi:MAG: hypothetical protein Q9159_003144 [Coniocarpon cinnabarinum]